MGQGTGTGRPEDIYWDPVQYLVWGKMDELRDVFLHGKPARILVGIKRGQEDKYASVLSREANCTYSHTVKILDTFEEHGLIEFRKEGRKKLVELTDDGRSVATNLENLMDDLGGLKPNGHA